MNGSGQKVIRVTSAPIIISQITPIIWHSLIQMVQSSNAALTPWCRGTFRKRLSIGSYFRHQTARVTLRHAIEFVAFRIAVAILGRVEEDLVVD